MLQLPGGGGSQQVMLQVRFAEVNRRAFTELGVSLFATRSTVHRALDDAAVPGADVRRHDDSSRDQVRASSSPTT